MSTSNGVVAGSATTMDYTKWAEMQQNPNPNPISDPNYPATYYHNPSYPYQQYFTATDPSHALPQSLPQPQPAPPGVDPTPYVPPQTYAQPPVSFEPPPAAAAAGAAPYYGVPSLSWQPDPSVSWRPDPNVSWHPDPNVSWRPDPNVSWHPDPNVSWPVAITHFGAPTYATGVTARNPAIRPQRSKPQQKKTVTQNTTKVVQSEWCEVCKVACNTKEVLDQHKSGKKHKKNLEKLKVASTSLPGPANVATASANVATLSTSPATVATSNAIVATSTPLPVATLAATDEPIVGPEKKSGKSKALALKNKARNRVKNLKRRATVSFTEDLETKRRKVMEGGTSENNVRACSICNVVCNSAVVFDTHLAGQKHTAMVNKLMSLPGVAPAM